VAQTAIAKDKGFVSLISKLFGWLFRKSACKATNRELESRKSKLEARPRADRDAGHRAPGA